MSAAIEQIDSNIAKVHARLKAMHWESEARKAGSQRTPAAMVWARVCVAVAQMWKEEALP